MVGEPNLYTRVGEVIHYIWDPIGISEAPGARDEYDTYLPDIMSILSTKPPEALVKYLSWIVTERMGLSANPQHDLKVVEILFSWKEFFSDITETQGN
ncbi:MAG: hypothetical protein DI551_07160 [Micavibrio aeruginosavorus]|uniref:Uncharacterized protein n=1 Tax=Micavibrio aeruginosavorus TaxID=349221 RepID=A0A2W5Q2C8_9BACT|nr:MAG: hypothetical protein DI551_07160 [Micavibrio aeruginosavorus]